MSVFLKKMCASEQVLSRSAAHHALCKYIRKRISGFIPAAYYEPLSRSAAIITTILCHELEVAADRDKMSQVLLIFDRENMPHNLFILANLN